MTQTNSSSYDIGIAMARAVLDRLPLLQEEHIDEAVASVVNIHPDINSVKLRRDLEALYNVFIPHLSVQDNFALASSTTKVDHLSIESQH